MNKQKIGFAQGALLLLAGFVGWYAFTAGNSLLLAWLVSGPLFIFIFVIGVIVFPLAPVPAVGSIVFLFTLKRKYPFSLWLAWGVLAAYLFNFLASCIFPPLLSLPFSTTPVDLTSPNGFIVAYIGIPFFVR